MLLAKILATEDLESLRYYHDPKIDQQTKEIIDFIKETGSFSAYDIGKGLSIGHAATYIQLCNDYIASDLQKETLDHCANIASSEVEGLPDIETWMNVLDRINIEN